MTIKELKHLIDQVPEDLELVIQVSPNGFNGLAVTPYSISLEKLGKNSGGYNVWDSTWDNPKQVVVLR